VIVSSALSVFVPPPAVLMSAAAGCAAAEIVWLPGAPYSMIAPSP
jgi:hypothetical protein